MVSVDTAISPTGWQCPACGVGVRGDVEVCPNCVKRLDEPGAKMVIRESHKGASAEELLRIMREKGNSGNS